VTAPQQIELKREHGTEGFEQDRFLLRALPSGPPTRRKAYWLPETEGNGVVLTWTDGFTGLTVKLSKNQKDLSGWAHPHFDGPRLVPRIAHATARPIPCTPNSGEQQTSGQ